MKFAYNFFALETYTIEADRPIPPGKHQVRMEFAYDGGGLGKGGNVNLFYDGKKVGEGRVQRTASMPSRRTKPRMSAATPARLSVQTITLLPVGLQAR